MHSTLALSSLLFALNAHAQSSPASSAATPTTNTALQPSASGASSVTQSGNLANLVDYLIPTASITSLSPEQVGIRKLHYEKPLLLICLFQSSKLESDAAVYFSQYTQSHPVSALEADIFIGAVLGGTSPSPAQETTLEHLLGAASSGLVNNPSAYISSVNAIISPFPFASEVQSYENGFVDGLRTVVAADLSLSVPPPSSTSTSSSKAAAAAPRPTGAIAGGVAAAAGLVGVALL